MDTNQKNTLYENKKGVVSKPYNAPQSGSSYFTLRPSTNTGSDNFSPVTRTLETPPTIITNYTTVKEDYESDSSGERYDVSSQFLDLRVTNPDIVEKVMPHEVFVTEDTEIQGGKQRSPSTLVTRSSQVAPPTQTNVSPLPQQAFCFVRDLPLRRRQSKTLVQFEDDEIENISLERNSQQTIHEQYDDNCANTCHTSSSDNCSATNILVTGTPRTSTQLANERARNNSSRYAKVSFNLTNNPNAIKLYREMAEKGDNTTQLVFAKYLLETANAFYPPHAKKAPPKIVGSRWGVSATTKKPQRPEPFLVGPSPGGGAGSIDGLSATSIHSGNGDYTPDFSTTPSCILGNALVAQKQQLSSVQTASSITLDESRTQKINALEEEAVKWIRKLAKQSVGEACYMLANWMDKELYRFRNNRAKSIELHLIASRSSIPESVFIVAQYYEDKGKATPARILELYRSAAHNDYVDAVYKMALLTLHGRLGLPQNLDNGFKLMYKACTLCTEEFNEPLFTFAEMLTNDYEDINFPSSLTDSYGGRAAAVLYYERAGKLDSGKAQAKLGAIYEYGHLGESMNFSRAFDCYAVAAINGDSKAMLGLSRLYNRGSHGFGDKDELYRLGNDVSGWLNATPVNEDLSFSWCQRAAKAGNLEALALLGWFYETGFGAPRDYHQTKKYYQLASNRGHTGVKSRLRALDSSITKHKYDEVRSKGLNEKTEPTIVVDRSMPVSKAKAKKKRVHMKKNNCYCM